MKKIGKVLAMFLVIANMFFIQVYAETYEECIERAKKATSTQEHDSIVNQCNALHDKIDNPDDFWEDTKNVRNNFWSKAYDWYNNSKKEGAGDTKAAKDIIDELLGYVEILGTTVIVIATATLGVKYIFGSVDSKAEIKENLTTLLVACVFFFGWNAIYNTLITSGNLFFISSGFKASVGNIYSTVMFVLNILAFVGVIYVGIKYIFSGASGRADLKGKSVYFVIGIIMTFATITLLTYISKVINQVV